MCICTRLSWKKYSIINFRSARVNDCYVFGHILFLVSTKPIIYIAVITHIPRVTAPQEIPFHRSERLWLLKTPWFGPLKELICTFWAFWNKSISIFAKACLYLSPLMLPAPWLLSQNKKYMTLLRQGTACITIQIKNLCAKPFFFPENKGMLISRIVKHRKTNQPKKKEKGGKQNIQTGHRSHH